MLQVRESVFCEQRSRYLDSPQEDLHEDLHSNEDSLKVASAKHFIKAESTISRWESRQAPRGLLGLWVVLGLDVTGSLWAGRSCDGQWGGL